MGTVLSVAEVAFMVITVLWVGRHPTARKVTATIALFALVEVCGVVIMAALLGTTPRQMYLEALQQQLQAMNGALTADQESGFQAMAWMVAGCWPALYTVSASAYVIIGLCIRWVYERARHATTWTPFSQVDLSVWWVVPLIVGIVVYVVSVLPGVPAADVVYLVGLNVLIVSVVPLFIQGAAAGKGIMDRLRVGLPWQICLGVLGLMTAVLFIVLPIMGLLDFWVNFRKLSRADQKPHEVDPD